MLTGENAVLEPGLKILSVRLWLHKGNMALVLLYLAAWSRTSSKG